MWVTESLLTCLAMSMVTLEMCKTLSWSIQNPGTNSNYNVSVRLVNRHQDTPIFVSLQRIRLCPKEIPDEKTWTRKKQQRRNRTKAADRQDQRPTQIQKEITGDCPAIDASTAHNKLEPRRGCTLISRGEM